VFAFGRLLSAHPITPGGLGIVDLGYIGGLVLAGRRHADVSVDAFSAQVTAAALVFRALTYGCRYRSGGSLISSGSARRAGGEHPCTDPSHLPKPPGNQPNELRVNWPIGSERVATPCPGRFWAVTSRGPGPGEPRGADAIAELLVPDRSAGVPHANRPVLEPHNTRRVDARAVGPLACRFQDRAPAVPGEAIG
jgi:hypothetical protein